MKDYEIGKPVKELPERQGRRGLGARNQGIVDAVNRLAPGEKLPVRFTDVRMARLVAGGNRGTFAMRGISLILVGDTVYFWRDGK